MVSEQGKPPDFVMEVASESTAEVDLNEKRDHYASIGVRELEERLRRQEG